MVLPCSTPVQPADVHICVIQDWLCTDSATRLISAFAKAIYRRLPQAVDGSCAIDHEDLKHEILLSILEAGTDQPAPETHEAELELVKHHGRIVSNQIKKQLDVAPVVTSDPEHVESVTVRESTTETESVAISDTKEARRAKLQLLLSVLSPVQRDAIERVYLGGERCPLNPVERNRMKSRHMKALRKMRTAVSRL